MCSSQSEKAIVLKTHFFSLDCGNRKIKPIYCAEADCEYVTYRSEIGNHCQDTHAELSVHYINNNLSD